MSESSERTWSQDDSRIYREIASVTVPARDEQIATLLTLLPFETKDSFCAVELGCGEGNLSHALLDAFPNSSMLALDGEVSMRAQTQERLQRFGPRAKVAAFDLRETNWLKEIESADCLLSSLCVHHLSGEEKQRLFQEIAKRLSMHGVLLMADLVEPQRPEARELFATSWDNVVKAQSIEKTGSTQLYEKYLKAQWNYFRYPDPVDQPSGLFEQLRWLEKAGFAVVDCFWMQAGHAIYGGYKSLPRLPAEGISFEAARRLVRALMY
jgi:tRNA (cmo5U34)-methyltransferase